jgi:Fe-S-cluster-containing dehydrogenase component/formate-dependent nitrite reductase membrane component NrfD
MNYGFIIDNRKCIGCHACTVACKSEHRVPLGRFRTWVTYVEKGQFPNVRRYFTVLRCNHCEEAPCVEICPTRALFLRPDGIVDFDSRHCIACKSCMAGCPYDALYLDPGSATAAKCNYCAHRIEVGLEPACVTACPERAIVAGDLDDPASPVSQLAATAPVSVRKPEKGTRPKVSYIAGETSALTPGMAFAPSSHIWSERPSEDAAVSLSVSDGGAPRTVYDIAHSTPWGNLVALYLWAKSLATGPIIVAALLSLVGLARAPYLFGQVAPVVALAMAFVTTLLLVGDLEHPERFLKILYHTNPRSWLVWGGYILLFHSGIVFLWGAAGFIGLANASRLLLWPGLTISVLASGYSGFVLAQARGRDLWQSRLLFPHLVVQSALAGSAVLSIAALYFSLGQVLTALLLRFLLGSVCLHGVLVLSEIALPHGTKDAGMAVRYMIQGPLALLFWVGAVLCGIGFPIYALLLDSAAQDSGSFLPGLACLMALAGLLGYEKCYVRAGQAPPLS